MTQQSNITTAHVWQPSDFDTPQIRAVRVDLAACLRMAAHLGLAEGICNHFSVLVPGHDDLFMVNPFGLAFTEVTPSSLLICDFNGQVVCGSGVPETTAFFIHAQVHRLQPKAVAVLHTHMPNATALAMLEGDPLRWAGQTALKFYGRVAVDDGFNGLALDAREGQRIAAAMGNAQVLFMKNHGVMVTGADLSLAWDDLYYLERAAEVQIRAMSTGVPLQPVTPEIAAKTAAQMRIGEAHSARAHLDSVIRQLNLQQPSFSQH
ncbi:aldolase [Pseudomonas sp.]|uniref:aldolase n=1 Tax=Pseudomonas sp. TaxID=306 RepID=UPI003A97B279